MDPSLKDLDKILGNLDPELQCGEGKLAEVCRWHLAFKKELQKSVDDMTELPVSWVVKDVLGGPSKQEDSEKESNVSTDVRDRALDYHKVVISDF